MLPLPIRIAPRVRGLSYVCRVATNICIEITRMPWSYEIDRESRLVITTAWDSCTAAEVFVLTRRHT